MIGITFHRDMINVHLFLSLKQSLQSVRGTFVDIHVCFVTSAPGLVIVYVSYTRGIGFMLESR
ncbi:hypothetical protein SERLA73DRAFT_179608 [Serpula lacrymans var. lacrymans S7.3]|uniref:Uncharacterized protein n=2 Tax=Serpula lacrymans var. lacrymans TaxID=341189 RepID=F8PVU6_SERL3|nr:uncharacterized protein SERLADRAFT_464795 [Serpula lacrymans var. lacrymans S7.9]EGN99542.1 hypothetical protein SERLA73DRAFT_179608 [Serpula lacrymans var. lacrymans S7.3]EGO25111.1 hypothetical protein SERLADRAFT_464795 [Serpula lacrymans var. lacrymans S7.9]